MREHFNCAKGARDGKPLTEMFEKHWDLDGI